MANVYTDAPEPKCQPDNCGEPRIQMQLELYVQSGKWLSAPIGIIVCGRLLFRRNRRRTGFQAVGTRNTISSNEPMRDNRNILTGDMFARDMYDIPAAM